ncbi:hypothetical protein [Nocardioides speluncae]|uniref:hypothetical protein n=1 Tax=Nocardioides speluncae TaxID=2670337 RepID=UPI000D69E660|nr:hypothetical protein [Nocardioides speluncae]
MRPQANRRVAVGLAVAAALCALAACGGDDDPDESEETPRAARIEVDSAKPAEGATLTTEHFLYAVPAGWRDARDQFPTVESAAVDAGDGDGFADNLSVLRVEPAPITDLAELESGLGRELAEAETKDIEVHVRTTIDGIETVHLSGIVEQPGRTYTVDQFNAVLDDASYILTFSYDTKTPADVRTSEVAAMLASWHWQP